MTSDPLTDWPRAPGRAGLPLDARPARRTASPYGAVATDRGRYYVHPVTGERWPSVTNVIDTGCGMSREPISRWSARQAAEAIAANLPSFAAMLDTDPDGALRLAADSATRERDRRADIGTALHAMCEAHTLGERVTPTAEMEPYWEQYLAYLARFRPTFAAAEATVINRTYGYAGTMDALCAYPHHPRLAEVTGGGLVVVDNKTSERGPWAEWSAQTAAYRRGETVLLDGGAEEPMPATVASVAVRIRPRTYDVHLAVDGDADFEWFAAMLRVTQHAHSGRAHYLRIDP